MASSDPPGSELHGAPEVISESKGLTEHSTPINDSENEETSSLVRKRASAKNAVWLFLSVILGIGWLGPIIFLLVVNIRGDTIGAAAWCVAGKGCNEISYQYGDNVTTYTQSQKYDIDNHNLLGALQFVAKALEVWYFYIATSLVWYVTVLLARRPGGLPVGYLLTHMEFGDLRALIDPLLYRAAGGRPAPQAGRYHKLRLYVFVSVVILMCLLANLMGPSVAVLVLPTLSWNTNPQTPDGQFTKYLASEAPSGGNAIPGCAAEDLANGHYDCTSQFYTSGLDALIMAATQEDDQYFNTPGDPDYGQTYYPFDTGKTQEQSIPFSFNITSSKNYQKSSDVVWALSRQTLRGLSSDFEGLFSVVLGNTTDQTLLDRYEPYNSSFELVLQRYGPVIGMPFFADLVGIDVWVTTLGNDQYIRCYNGYSSNPDTAKCMRTGLGWNTSTAMAEFFLDLKSEVNETIQVLAYWSDKAVYVGGTPDPNGCFPNGTLLVPADTCDYEQLFATPGPVPDADDQPHDAFVVEYTLPNTTASDNAFVIQFFPAYGFATYSIDVTQIWPSLPPAEVAAPPTLSEMQPIVIHPAWYLSAWGVNAEAGVSASADRGYYMQDAVTDLFYHPTSVYNDDFFRWREYNFYAMAQAASLAAYTTGPNPANADNLPPFQPQLWSSIYNEAWGWSISSRTSKLGLTVCLLGALTVITRTVLLLLLRIEENSSLEIITTALRHIHHNEITEAGHRELDRARIRYRILEDEEEGLRFHHVRPHTPGPVDEST